MGKGLFLGVQTLERRKIEFDERFASGSLDLGDWTLPEELRTEGSAELLDLKGTRTIRVKGTIASELEGVCGRCLENFREKVAGPFELYYYSAEGFSGDEDRSISGEDANIGFYEEPGLPLADVVQEQVALWLPISGACRDDCKGLCPHCGVNRNQTSCSCDESKGDLRWEALKSLKLDR